MTGKQKRYRSKKENRGNGRMAGLDESGKGPVIGPMCVAIVILNMEDGHKLASFGVKDSKLLTPSRRENLYEAIKNTVIEYRHLMITASEIDELRENGINMNKIVVKAMGALMKETKAKANIYYADASDTDIKRFHQRLLPYLPPEAKLVCEHKADQRYFSVAAASIIAKVERDKEIKKLQEKYGDIGSGYPSDPKTIQFLKKVLKKGGEYPSFVRKTWQTAKDIKQAKTRTRITGFF